MGEYDGTSTPECSATSFSTSSIYTSKLESQFPGAFHVLKLLQPIMDSVRDLPVVRTLSILKLWGTLQKLAGDPFPLPLFSPGNTFIDFHKDQVLGSNLKQFLVYSICAYSTTNLHMDRLKFFSNIDSSDGMEALLLKVNPDVDMLETFPSNDGQVPSYMIFADHLAKHLVVSIRGSAETADWLMNLACELAEDFHCGMIKAADRLLNRIRPTLDRFLTLHPNFCLHLCGHSLGGGIASLMAIRLRQEGSYKRNQPRAWSYGSPCSISRSDYLKNNNMYKEYVVSAVYGADIIARISYKTVLNLIKALGKINEYAERNESSPIHRTGFTTLNDMDLLSGRRSNSFSSHTFKSTEFYTPPTTAPSSPRKNLLGKIFREDTPPTSFDDHHHILYTISSPLINALSQEATKRLKLKTEQTTTAVNWSQAINGLIYSAVINLIEASLDKFGSSTGNIISKQSGATTSYLPETISEQNDLLLDILDCFHNQTDIEDYDLTPPGRLIFILSSQHYCIDQTLLCNNPFRQRFLDFISAQENNSDKHLFVQVDDPETRCQMRIPVIVPEAVTDHLLDMYCGALAPELLQDDASC